MQNLFLRQCKKKNFFQPLTSNPKRKKMLYENLEQKQQKPLFLLFLLQQLPIFSNHALTER